MRKPALFLTAALAAGFAAAAPGAAIAQPAPDQPPPGMGPPGGYAPGGPPPGSSGEMGPPPGQMSGPPGAPHGAKGKFESANVTHDGRLTLDQAQAAGWHGVAKHFGEIDRDHKGYVTLQDIHAWTVARREARHGGAPGAPPPGAAMQGPPPQ